MLKEILSFLSLIHICGFIGIALNKGESHLEMYFVPEGFKLGMTISAFGCILAVVLFGLERKKKHEYKEK